MTTNKNLKITDFNISWTADHEQYWQGHGIATTDYTHTATGVGDTLREAFEDALDVLVRNFDGALNTKLDPGEETYWMMLANLTSQVKESAMLNCNIVKSYCNVQSEHKRECSNADPTDEDIEHAACAYCHGTHYYVSIDVKVEEGE